MADLEIQQEMVRNSGGFQWISCHKCPRISPFNIMCLECKGAAVWVHSTGVPTKITKHRFDWPLLIALLVVAVTLELFSIWFSMILWDYLILLKVFFSGFRTTNLYLFILTCCRPFLQLWSLVFWRTRRDWQKSRSRDREQRIRSSVTTDQRWRQTCTHQTMELIELSKTYSVWYVMIFQPSHVI